MGQRFFGDDPHRHIGRHHFLDQQFQGIRYLHQRKGAAEPGHLLDVGLRQVLPGPRRIKLDRAVRRRAEPEPRIRVADGDEARRLAHRHIVLVGPLHHRLLQEIGQAVARNRIALHLADTQPTIVRATPYRLACQGIVGPIRTEVDLVLDHVFEPHVVHRPEEDVRLALLARHTVVHDLVARRVEAIGPQFLL